jgi:Tol biopolymer transport system component
LRYRALAAIFLLGATVSAALYWRPAHAPPRVITAEITPPSKVRFNLSALGGEPALSPDGRAVAISGTDESGKTLLWVRSLDSLEARALAGTEGAADPFWSPDGRKVGFFAGGKLKSLQASGGPAVVVAGGDLDNAGGSWNRDGTILLVPRVLNGIYKVTAAGGNPLPVITDFSRSRDFGHPRFLPDGKHFLYLSGGNDPALRGTYFASLDGKENHLVMAGGTFGIYAAGFLLYLNENSLMAQAFDPERGVLRESQPSRVADHVSRSADLQHCTFDASENVLIYGPTTQTNEKRLIWFDRAGKNLGTTGTSEDYFDVRLSADGRKLASNAGSPNSDIWVDDLARGVRTRLTMDPDIDDGVPVWSPDGNRIAFAANGGKVSNGIYQKSSNGAGREELLLASPAQRGIWPTSWSRDGRFILYSSEIDRRKGVDIWVLPLVGERRPRPFVQATALAYDGQFSPNGRWVAYISEESGRAEVYVVPFAADRFLRAGDGLANTDRNDRWQVSSGGGRCARWRSDGKEIFYLAQTNQMMAAKVEEKGLGLVVESARALFKVTLNGSTTSSSEYYDVSPDGKKFVVNSYVDDHSSLIVLVNWMTNLKQQ